MAKQIKQDNQMAKRQKELAILRAQNELLESAKETAMEHYKDNPEKAEELAEQFEHAKNENVQKGANFYQASPTEIENSSYGTVTEAGINEYNEHLRRRGITDESKLYQKDISGDIKSATLEYGKKNNENVDEDDFHLEKVEMPTIDIDNNDVDGKYSYERPAVSENNYRPEVQVVKNEDKKNWEIPSNIQFDILPLPSNGECYKHKKDRVAVGYLTASDENAITSPNLYRGGKVLDVILKRKVLEKGIDPDDLVSGDRDMILLWLRATGYGVDFPIQVRDPQTGTVFDSVVDLSKIKTKEFKLKGDENGYFDFITSGNDVIKFKFLTHKEEISFDKSFLEETREYQKAKLFDLYRDLMDELDESEDMAAKNKERLEKAINLIKEWSDSIEVKVEKEDAFDSSLTEKMIAKTMSINGNTDRKYIREYISNMRAMDARKYRLYMQDNEPGMDFEITVNRPESLGGGSFTTFLSLDSFIFLSVA